MKITNDQIIAMNTLLADHVVQTTELQEDDSELVQYVRCNADPSIILAAVNLANSLGLHAYVTEYHGMLKITSFISFWDAWNNL